jgi:hypothetical protein
LGIRTVRFRQSGGFGGLVRGCEAAPADLDAAECRALERHAHAKRAGAMPAADSGARDLVVYEIEIETDSGATRLEFDEIRIPEDLAALIGRLQKRSRPMSP